MLRNLVADATLPRSLRPLRVVQGCARLNNSPAFNMGIVVVILLNAVVLGVATYPSVTATAGGVLTGLERLFLLVFLAEVLVRLIAHGRRPQDFFRNGWNLFDLLVVAAAFVPGLSANATLLRLARLARVLRVVRFFPALRTILIGVVRSLPGLGGFIALSVLTLYIYGMVGWMLFGHVYPAQYGTVGRAILTLFLLLSLETLPDAVDMGLAVGPWTLIYFVSYVLVASYLLVNVLIGVVINSMEETRRAELNDRTGDGLAEDLDRKAVAQRLEELRAAVASLETELRVSAGTDR